MKKLLVLMLFSFPIAFGAQAQTEGKKNNYACTKSTQCGTSQKTLQRIYGKKKVQQRAQNH